MKHDDSASAPGDRALDLLRAVDVAPALSPAARRRILAKLDQVASPRRLPIVWGLAGLGGCAALALLFVLLSRTPEVPGGSFQVPSGMVARLSDGDAYLCALIGPARAEHHRGLRLVEGRMLVRSHDHAVEIQLPGARLLLGPSSTGEVVVVSGRVTRFAGFEGLVELVDDQGRTVSLVEGTVWMDASVRSMSQREREDAQRALGESLSNAPAPREAELARSAHPGEGEDPPVSPARMPQPGSKRRDPPRPAGALGQRQQGVAASEAALLGRAIKLLRGERDARAALVLLDSFEQGATAASMREEAALVRVEALMSLGDDRAALAVLDKLPLPGVANGPDLLLLRADLRAKATRCREAIEDYSLSLTAGMPALDERALVGRASCRFVIGDVSAAKDDLTLYLRRFPDGRSVADVKRALGIRPP